MPSLHQHQQPATEDGDLMEKILKEVHHEPIFVKLEW